MFLPCWWWWWWLLSRRMAAAAAAADAADGWLMTVVPWWMGPSIDDYAAVLFVGV